VFSAGLRRLATEALRGGMERADGESTLKAVLAEAVRRVDAFARPDRSREIERLRQRLPVVRMLLATLARLYASALLWPPNRPRRTVSRPTPRSWPTSLTLPSGCENGPNWSAFGGVAQRGEAAFRAPNSGPDL
jgi:hypothetical protein